MATRRQLAFWTCAAVSALALLIVIVVWLQAHAPRRVTTTFLMGDPAEGARLFERKGCSRCHAVNGWGGHLAPDLGAVPVGSGDLNQLVPAMWNHAPEMWKRMAQEKVTAAPISESEMASLFAYLYVARYLDEPGDTDRGERMFRSKGCIRCHSVDGAGGDIGPDLAKIPGVDTPIEWTQTMWNHAPSMEAGMQRVGLQWPNFNGREMNDLLAYIREKSGGLRSERELLPANPYNGWKVFQDKGCIDCHSVKGEGGTVGPELGSREYLPSGMVEFAGVMWNHSPGMFRTMKERKIDRPQLEGKEMADLMAFLAGLRYFERTGSIKTGASLFTQRGCANCHGPQGEGTSKGPRLRGNGQGFGTIALATALWSHGPEMYQRTKSLGLPWPRLGEADLGDLIAFINASPQERH